MNPNPLVDPRNRNYLIAGVGGAVAVISFFLPFATYTITGYSSGAIPGSGIGILWLFELLQMAVVAASALLIYRPYNPFGLMTVPLAKQARWVAFGFIGAGALGFLVTLLNLVNYSAQFSGYSAYYGAATVSTGWGIGAILFMLGSAATAVAGTLLVMNKSIGTGAANYVGQSPYQSNPYAQGQPPQYPPTNYQGGYPPQQQPSQYPPQTTQPPYAQPEYPPQTPYPPQQQQQPPQYPPYQ
jgi:hypothetical protein